MASSPELVRDVGEQLAPEIEVAAGRNVVVVIGIDRYEAWPYLANAVNDARGTAAAFRRLGFTEVSTLLDGAATRDALHKLVTDDLATLRNTDSLVVFFAGHGGTRPQEMANSTVVKTGFIIPVDGEDKQGQVATWIRLDTWLDDIARLPPMHILVILDACHSGIALEAVRGSRDAATSRDGADGYLSSRMSRKVIVAALGDEVALDGGPRPGHSLFTGYLLEALSGGLARDGRETASGTELGLYLHTRVTRAGYQNQRQTPRCKTFDMDDDGELMIPVRSAHPAIVGASQPRALDQGDGRLSPTAMPSLLDPPDPDVNAPLRARLADTLANLVSDRKAIAQLLAEHAPRLPAKPLPGGASTAIWSQVLVELTNAGALTELSAILDAVRDRSRRARRIDWPVFSALLRPHPGPAIVSWSHARLEIRRYTAASGDRERAAELADPAFITSGDALLEAVVTQQWIGAQPPAPAIEVTSTQLFGATIPLLHQRTQLPGPEPATARWLVRIPVPRARIRTRRVTVRCAGTPVMEQRYIVPRIGSLCATALWLACAAAAVIALKPILPFLTTLPFILSTAVVGLLPSLGIHVVSQLTGRHSFRRLLYAWELAAPLAVLAVAIVFAVPPWLFVLTTNANPVPVRVSNGRTIPPDATPQTRLRSDVDAWHLEKLEEPFCQCGRSRRCLPCDAPASSGRFHHIALGCTAGRCDRLTHYLDSSGDARISRPLDTKVSAIRFGPGSLGPQMTLNAGDITVEALDLPDHTTEQALDMLPGPTGYSIEFLAPDKGHELLQCDTAANHIVRLTIDEPAATAVPTTGRPASAPDPIDIAIGQTASHWTGATARLRACRDDRDRGPPKLALKIPEGALACQGEPIERVVVLDPPAPAGQPPRPPGIAAQLQIAIGAIRSTWTPAAGSRAVRACLGSPGDVEIKGVAQGAAVTLPHDLAFRHLRVHPARARAGATVEVRCNPGDTLRIVALQNVNARTRFRTDAPPVALLDDTTGATCAAPGAVVQLDGAPCKLTEENLTCPRRIVSVCLYDTGEQSIARLDSPEASTCRTPARGMVLDDARKLAGDKHLDCEEIYSCR